MTYIFFQYIKRAFPGKLIISNAANQNLNCSLFFYWRVIERKLSGIRVCVGSCSKSFKDPPRKTHSLPKEWFWLSECLCNLSRQSRSVILLFSCKACNSLLSLMLQNPFIHLFCLSMLVIHWLIFLYDIVHLAISISINVYLYHLSVYHITSYTSHILHSHVLVILAGVRVSQ